MNELDDWLQATVAVPLRESGYRGGPRRFDRREDDICKVVQFQGSVGNVSGGACRFVVNLGVWSARLAKAAGTDRQACPPAMDSHICIRLGELGPDHAETWWDIGAGANRDDVHRALLEALTHEGLPFLDGAGTAEGFRSFWLRSGGEVGVRYVSLLDGLK